MIKRIRYWIFNWIHHRKGYMCFCPTCKYYYKCIEDDGGGMNGTGNNNSLYEVW